MNHLLIPVNRDRDDQVGQGRGGSDVADESEAEFGCGGSVKRTRSKGKARDGMCRHTLGWMADG